MLNFKEESGLSIIKKQTSMKYLQRKLFVPLRVEFLRHGFGSLFSLANLDRDIRVASACFILGYQPLGALHLKQYFGLKVFRNYLNKWIIEALKAGKGMNIQLFKVNETLMGLLHWKSWNGYTTRNIWYT